MSEKEDLKTRDLTKNVETSNKVYYREHWFWPFFLWVSWVFAIYMDIVKEDHFFIILIGTIPILGLTFLNLEKPKRFQNNYKR